ncbi:hypothetical protein [Hymenobacter cellulosilyticus]|uniref:Uncharacterized protein n=1 Tax=Hymenobacter cellulosilyticus TaxID=2932248 RepID=A0A8T9Q4U4_9BACT|nr:hypothetical protein [Hymenobacter cellulosilyticus]UOQ72604.1 hypothetical protein MUN79_00975 [Hymenobacter cellulosilyticus]
MPLFQRHNTHYVVAVLAGLFFALLGRFTFASELLDRGGGLLMLGFLVLVPVGLGVITEHFSPVQANDSWSFIFRSWSAVMLFMVAAFIFHLEGAICLIIIAPLFVALSAVGVHCTGS